MRVCVRVWKGFVFREKRKGWGNGVVRNNIIKQNIKINFIRATFPTKHKKFASKSSLFKFYAFLSFNFNLYV